MWPVYGREELCERGVTARQLTASVRTGRLVRARKGAYLSADADPECISANRIGGRLACVSELARWGVFVLDRADIHVAVHATSSRLHTHGCAVRVHWTTQRADGWASVGMVEALVQAMTCQPVRAAIATLDSALHLGLIDDDELTEIIATLPRRLRVVGRLLDRRAESGSESLMRLLLRGLGCDVEVQVRVDGVGRVDFLVDGWLIIECDSRAHHGDWSQRREDLRRDQEAAARGMATYRPIAEDIFWHTDRVLAAVRGLLALHSAAS